MVWNQSVWRKVIDSKYGYDICQWTPKRCKGLMRWGFGITLRKGWDQFASHIRYEVGDGSQELFWKNHWDGNSSFQDRHPELFRFNRDKDARVFDCMEWVQSKAHWRPIFIQDVQDWELESLTQFLDDLYAAQVGSSGGDEMVWLPSTNKGFQIKSYYTVINTRAAHTPNFPWKCVWRGISPPSTHICLGGKTGKISSGK